MVIAPAKESWHIGRADVLVDVVLLAQPLRGTRVNRDFGEGTLAVLERTDPALGGGVAAQRLPTGGYAPTKECANAIEQVRVHLSPRRPSRQVGAQTDSARLGRRAPRTRVLAASKEVTTVPRQVPRSRRRQHVQTAH